MDPFLVKTVNDAGISLFQKVSYSTLTSRGHLCTENCSPPKVNAASGEGGNVVLSPVAVNLALASACAASEGASRDQVREALRHRLLGMSALQDTALLLLSPQP